MARHRKLDPPAKWELKPSPDFKGMYLWRMIQCPIDNALPPQERGNCIYSREWISRGDFETWLRDRYKIEFVRQVMAIWEL